jgi:hypothetical protein
MCIYDKISLNFSHSEKYFGQILYRKAKHILCQIIVLPEGLAVYNTKKYGKTGHATNNNII